MCFSAPAFLPLFFLLLFPTLVSAVQSIFSCPLNAASVAGIPGTFPSFAGALGEVCGTGSFMHYWTCCEDYPFECCFHFQPVFLAMLCVILVALLLFGIGRFLIAMQREER